MSSKRTLVIVAVVAVVFALLAVFGGRLLTSVTSDTVFSVAQAPGKNGGQDAFVPPQYDIASPGAWNNPICQVTSIPSVYNPSDRFQLTALSFFFAKNMLAPPGVTIAVAVETSTATEVVTASASNLPTYTGYNSLTQLSFTPDSTLFPVQTAGETIKFCVATDHVLAGPTVYIGNGQPTQGVYVEGTLALDAMAGFAATQLANSEAPPLPTLNFDTSCSVGGYLATCDLTASGGVSPYRFSYTFNQGSQQSAKLIAPGHMQVVIKYSAPGTYSFTGTVEDAAYQTKSKTVSIAIAKMTDDFTFTADGRAVSFSGAAFNAQLPVLAYLWEFGDGTNISTSSNTTSHIYGSNGTFLVTLSVIDSGNQRATVQHQILVADNGNTNPPPPPPPPPPPSAGFPVVPVVLLIGAVVSAVVGFKGRRRYRMIAGFSIAALLAALAALVYFGVIVLG